LVTWYLFPIGVFPWVMIFSTLIFFHPKTHERVLARLERLFSRKPQSSNVMRPMHPVHPITRYFLMLFIAAQLLIPFRYVLYPGDLFWNEEGFRFSWRVMLMHKEGYATFYLHDKATGR
jgi:hypothetical protein